MTKRNGQAIRAADPAVTQDLGPSVPEARTEAFGRPRAEDFRAAGDSALGGANGPGFAAAPTEGEPKKSEGLFGDLSLAQVIAGALAAVTSMLLSSYIGIAGSVIGVAVASIVSAVSSQVYKKMISASANKISDAAGLGPSHDSGDARAANGDYVRELHVPGEAGVVPAGSSPAASHNPLPPASALWKARSQRRRKKEIQRNAIIVSIVSALVAIAVCAAAIQLVTAGEGLGEKPQHATVSKVSTTSDAGYPAGGSDSEGAASTEQDVSSANGGSASSGSENTGSAAGESGTGESGSGADSNGTGGAGDTGSSEGSESGTEGSGSDSSGSGSGSSGSDSDSASGGSGSGGSSSASPNASS